MSRNGQVAMVGCNGQAFFFLEKKTYYSVGLRQRFLHSCNSEQYSTLFTLKSRDAHGRVTKGRGMAGPLFLGPLAFPPTTWTAKSARTSFDAEGRQKRPKGQEATVGASD